MLNSGEMEQYCCKSEWVGNTESSFDFLFFVGVLLVDEVAELVSFHSWYDYHLLEPVKWSGQADKFQYKLIRQTLFYKKMLT